MTAKTHSPNWPRNEQSSSHAADELFQLQVEQLRHDEMYHREIARLPIQHRLAHMALHLAKYVGGLAAVASGRSNQDTLDRLLTDTVIIALSVSNILNARTAELLDQAKTTSAGLSELAADYQAKYRFGDDLALALLLKLAMPVGEIAKACESADHLEPIVYRDVIKPNLAEVFKLALAGMAARGLPLVQTIHARLESVKSRSIFHGQI